MPELRKCIAHSGYLYFLWFVEYCLRHNINLGLLGLWADATGFMPDLSSEVRGTRKVTKPKKSPKKSKIPQRLRGITASNLSMHTYNLPTSCIVIVLSLRCQVGRYRRRNADSVSRDCRVPRTCP